MAGKPATCTELLNNQTARKDMVENIVNNAKEHQLAGMMIDFEEASRADRKQLVGFMQELKTRFDSEHLTLAQAVPVGDNAYDLKALAANVDYIVPMVYDEHYQSGEPGPIASEDWFEKELDRLGKILPEEKTGHWHRQLRIRLGDRGNVRNGVLVPEDHVGSQRK